MMRLSMSALEHHRAGIAFREAFSFSERQIRELLPVLKEKSGSQLYRDP